MGIEQTGLPTEAPSSWRKVCGSWILFIAEMSKKRVFPVSDDDDWPIIQLGSISLNLFFIVVNKRVVKAASHSEKWSFL